MYLFCIVHAKFRNNQNVNDRLKERIKIKQNLECWLSADRDFCGIRGQWWVSMYYGDTLELIGIKKFPKKEDDKCDMWYAPCCRS